MGRVSIGGQAVIEGVMMKNADKYAIAVRKPDKDIIVEVKDYVSVGDRIKLFKLPIIRGVFNFIESMVIGIKTLTFSSEFYVDEDEEERLRKKQEKLAEKEEKARLKNKPIKEKKKKAESDESLSASDIFFTVTLSVVMAIGMFMLLPAWIATLLDDYITNSFALGLVEGVIRLLIFLLYVWLISRLEDIKRTFMYHGAEHKTINCLEAGKELTVENVMESSRFHKRCGTSFLFIVMIVSILVFMCIRTETIWLRMLYRVLLVPVIAGISYEFIRFAGKSDSLVANVLSKPGLLVQRFTTKEPTEDMVEVAIKSVEGVLDWREYLEKERAAGNL